MIDRLKRFNWISFAAMIALITVGTIAIYSAGGAREQAVMHSLWKANLWAAVIGLFGYCCFAFTDYRKVFEYFATPIYIVSVVLLVAVLLFGTYRFGGRRWLWFFQPSEVAKLCLISFLAYLYGGLGTGFHGRRRLRGFLIAGAVIGVPALLILLEPDLGTMLTLIPATLLMLFVARVWRKGLVLMLATIGLIAVSVLVAVYEAEKPGVDKERREKIMKFVPLREHQVKRVKVFLDPEADFAGAGYNLRQAKISIGSGGAFGKGLRKGEMNHLKYLPPSVSMNDFIFCVFAEETGFFGTLVLLGLYALLLLPCVWTAYRATDGRGRLFALGFATLIFAHVFINIGMSIGMVPITGLPLPFISTGRTFLITVMSGLGLIQSVAIYGREKR